jgi:hypothetical protein
LSSAQSLHKYARLAQRVEEVAALLGAKPLSLMTVVLLEPGDQTGGDVEAAKARTLAAHLAVYPQDAGREIQWAVCRVEFVKPDPQPEQNCAWHATLDTDFPAFRW